MTKRNFMLFIVTLIVQLIYICVTETFDLPNGLLSFFFVFDGPNATYITIYALALVLYATEFDYTLINNHFEDLAMIRKGYGYLWCQIRRVVSKATIFAIFMMITELLLIHHFKQSLFPLNRSIDLEFQQLLAFSSDPLTNHITYALLRLFGSIVIAIFFLSLSRYIKHRYLYMGCVPAIIIGSICVLGVLGPALAQTLENVGLLPEILSTLLIGNVFSAGFFQMRTPRLVAAIGSILFYGCATIFSFIISTRLKKKGVL